MPSRRPAARSVAQRARLRLGMEPLERRLVAAGDVTARLVGPTLFMAGDAQANEINVASVAGGRIAVLGADTTINGSATPFVTAAPVKSIVARLAAGDDVVAFSNTSYGVARLWGFVGEFGSGRAVVPQEAIDAVAAGVRNFSVPGSIVLTAGVGDDTVLIVGDVGGSVTVSLGPANDTQFKQGNLFGVGLNVREFNGDLSNSRIGGSLSVTGGAGADSIGIYACSVGRSVRVALGLGTNTSEMVFVYVNWGIALTSPGSCSFRLNSSFVRNAVTLALGGDGNNVLISDRTSLVRASVGSIAVTTGAGDDFVRVGDLDVGAGVSIASGAGADAITLGGSGMGPVVGGSVAIASGAGADAVEITRTEVRGSLTVALGQGDDALTVRYSRALAMWLFGGPGFNTLTLNAQAPRGIRRYQFQVVTA